jgi:MFS family permease
VTLRAIAPSVFLPALVYEIGNGAIAPIIVLTALKVGASPATAGFMVTLLGVGQLIGDVPAASLADRLGDRHAMLLAAAVACLAQLGCLLAGSQLLLGLCLLVIGTSNSTYYLARQTYITEVVPVRLRARALSTLAGSHRIGLFLGPFVGAAAIDIAGLRASYAVAMITAASAAVLLLVIADVARPADMPKPVRGTATAASMLRSHRRLFATLGVAVLAVGAVRAARQTVLPLWSHHIGLSAEQTSLIFGLASLLDMALFYPSGLLMDRHGRLSIAIPSMLILGTTMVLLPLTREGLALTVVAMAMSLGNGFGSGIIMTVGADVAPADNRTRFLSVWRVMSDSGNALGPVVVSVVAALLTLAAGIVAIGSVGFLAAAGLLRWVPKYSAFATPAMLRATRASESDVPD